MANDHRKSRKRPHKSHAQEANVRIGRGMGVRQERVWGSFCHLAAFAGLIIPFGGMVLGPLALWLLRKENSRLVDREGKKAMNFQLSMFVYLLMGLALTQFYLGYAVLALLVCLNVVCIVAASVKTNNGEDFQYPLVVRFIK